MRERLPQKQRGVRPPDAKSLLDELDGYLDLGMRREALRLARQILRRHRIKAAEFNGVLGGIMIQGDRVNGWKPAVEEAYARLSKRSKRAVRGQMLAFYQRVEDWDQACRFLPARATSGCDLMYAMETLLNLRKLAEAKRLRKRCRRMLRHPQDAMDAAALLLSLAKCHAHLGELRAAERCFMKLLWHETFAGTAMAGCAELEAVRGLSRLEMGLRQIEAFRKFGTDDGAIMLPNNRDGLFADDERKLKRYQKAFYKIVPKDQLWKYGWSAEQT